MREPKQPTSSSETAWTPILEGKLADEARASIERVVEALGTEIDVADTDYDLPHGTAGYALTFSYIAKSLDRPDLLESVGNFLDAAADRVASEMSWPALHGGFVGVAWNATHIATLRGEEEADDMYEDVDSLLAEFVESLPTPTNYDLVSGLVGIGIYALERWPANSARAILERVRDKLVAMAEDQEPGVTWFTPPEMIPEHQLKGAPHGYYNLGLAHGVPGVIGLLGRASGVGALDGRATEVLERAVDWLLAQGDRQSDLWFPSWRARGVESGRGSRVAWCYGDLGLSAALFVAGDCHGRSDWCQEALSIARNCAGVVQKETGVLDHGLCHGSAGNAIIFDRMAQSSGDEILKAAAHSWYRYTLETRTSDVGIDGYATWIGKDPKDEASKAKMVREPGLLTGVAGVVLALAAGVSHIDPGWDRALLVSSHPRERGIAA